MVKGGMCGRRDGHCSGQYASYWNAFLFMNIYCFGDTNPILIFVAMNLILQHESINTVERHSNAVKKTI